MKARSIITGAIIGCLLMGMIVWFAMPPMMINVHQSKYGFDETIAMVEQAVTARQGWKVSQVFDIQKNILDAGHQDMTRVKIVALCNPHYAYRILSDDEDKVVSTMMPLGIGVYETKDGKVYLSDMNIGLMGRMFGGTIAEVMGDASSDISGIVATVAVEST
jgi:uncharacterized protein (DUF302 family)